MEAAGRADAAYTIGGMFNVDPWTWINKAVAVLGRQGPKDGGRLNDGIRGQVHLSPCSRTRGGIFPKQTGPGLV